MKRPAFAFALLALAAVLQWALPVSLAVQSERTLREGTRYYLRTAPVDPVDAFRGRYVALSFEGLRVAAPAGAGLQAGDRVCVPLTTGPDRFVRFGAPQREPPTQGDYLVARIAWIDAAQVATLRLPFDRYYLEERAAPAAERAYRDAHRASAERSDAYVSVRVRDGHAVLEELFIGNVPVRRLLAAGGA